MRRTLFAFRHAWRGWRSAWERERNVRVHVVIAVLAVVLGTWLHLSLLEWALVATVIGLVLAAELLNTASERLVDLAQWEQHPLAREAKDIAAGGVLVAALAAVVVGLLVFGPKLLVRIG